jgi:hypothetical protein
MHRLRDRFAGVWMAAQAKKKEDGAAPTGARRPRSLMERLAEAERERIEAETKQQAQK